MQIYKKKCFAVLRFCGSAVLSMLIILQIDARVARFENFNAEAAEIKSRGHGALR